MNIVHVDYQRLTPLGWALVVMSWLSIATAFIAPALGATGLVGGAAAILFLASILLFRLLDYASNAVHKPRPSQLSSLATEMEGLYQRRRDDA